MQKKKIKKVLVANRGEIAIRISRAVQEEGKIAVAVYELPDKESKHIRIADEAILIGEGPRKDYLNIGKIIKAAKFADCQAIHPGYGFLAENADLPKACEENGIIFIGPSYKAVRDLGDKTIARDIARKGGIPIIPGSGTLPEKDGGLKAAVAFGEMYGYPIMIKAVAGGGGRGVRKVFSEDELRTQMPLAYREALSSFSDGRLYLEKALVRARHIEVQILSDNYGNIIHLGTRNCSIQRRHQKLVEIAPGLVSKTLEEKICSAAINFAQIANYRSAGTVEFLIDQNDNFYFLEINTRLQVEHTVTEVVTGIDIVRRQIKIAEGKELDIEQKDIFTRGFAIELRINAEDPQNNFIPDSGKEVVIYQSPGGPGIRLDGFVYQGYVITGEYDSLLVKLTVSGFTWHEAISRLNRALKNFTIKGPKTTIPFYQKLIEEKDFIERRFDVEFLDNHPEIFRYKVSEREEEKIAKFIAQMQYDKKNKYS